MSVTKPLYFDNCTGFPSMSFASKPKIVVAGGAAFAILAPYKIPTELSENPANFAKCAAEYRPCPQTSSCVLINRSMNYFRSMTGTRVCCVTWRTLKISYDVLLMRRVRNPRQSSQSRSQSPRVIWSAPRHGAVLALTKWHVGSGNEIAVILEWTSGSWGLRRKLQIDQLRNTFSFL